MKSSKQYNLKGAVRDLGPAQFLDGRGRVISRRDPNGKLGREVGRGVYWSHPDLCKKIAD
jgi:hypothetical protein